MKIKNLKKLYSNKFKFIKEKSAFLFREVKDLSYIFGIKLITLLIITEIKYLKEKNLTANYQDFYFSKNMITESTPPKYYKKNYKFDHMDSFTLNVYIWNKFFKKYKLTNKIINYLEIGSFEGRSSVYVLENLNNAYCYFVDPFEEYEEMTKSTNQNNFSSIYNNFKINVGSFRGRYEIFKTTSDNFFENLEKTKKFDLIYIDGSHLSKDVYADAINSNKIIREGGFIIFDDFFWFWYPNLEDNPFFGISKFLYENRKKYKIIYLGDQLIIRKTKT